MKICLARHAETVFNKLGKMQGKENIPLSDEGRNQVKELKERIKDNHYDICFSSPLVRCVETAMILVGDKTEIRVDDRLIERDLGELEGKFREEYDVKKYWDYNLNSGDLGVEKVQDIFKRCNDFIDYLKENYNDKTILIVSHNAPLKAIYHIINNTDLNHKNLSIKIDNCYYNEFEV